MEMKSKAYIYLVVSLIIGSITPVLLILTQGGNAFELFFLASLASVPIGMALLFRNKKTGALVSVLKNKRKLFYLAIAALLIYIPYEYGIAYAEHFISASLATVLFRLNPLLMLLFLPVLLRERLSKRQILALSLAMIGIVIGVSGGIGAISSGVLPIIFFVILLALGYAFALVVIKWQMIDNEVFLAVATVVLSAFFGVLFFSSGAVFSPMSATDIGIIAWLAVTNIFNFGMYMYALKILKTTVVTNVFMLSPFLTFLWASAIFGEQIQLYYLAIAALVGVGMMIQRNDVRGGTYVSRKPKSNNPHGFVTYDVTGAFAESTHRGIRDVIESGGRVLATKLDKKHTGSVSNIINSQKYSHVYNGNEAFIFNESKFVKNVLGVNESDTVIIKAGPNTENDDFFAELNNSLPTIR